MILTKFAEIFFKQKEILQIYKKKQCDQDDTNEITKFTTKYRF